MLLHLLFLLYPFCQANNSFQELFDSYFKWKLETYPEWATKLGFSEYNGMSEDFTLNGIKKKTKMCKHFLKRSHQLKAGNVEIKTYQAILEVIKENTNF